MTKILWIICFLLIFILAIVIGNGYFSSYYKTKKAISGAKTELPSLDINSLQKPPQEKINASDPKIYAKSAILIDETSFKILFQKDSDIKVPIASTTKMMTAMVVLEDYPNKMKDVVTVTREMANVEGSGANLRIGERMSVENLLKGMLIVSGNDAAYSLASYLSGKDDFMKKMNEKAQLLGLNKTFYKDPAGLDDEGYSSAHDLAILASYAMRHKEFATIVGTPVTTITSEDGRIVHELKNSNRMLRVEEQFYYPFAIGIKTGFTPAAGHCLISSAQKDNHRLIAVILNTDENTLTASAEESRKLLDWGFNNWTW